MPRISLDQNVIALINTFTVEPHRQHELLEILEKATNDVMSQLPGFVSASVHASLDGTRVCNYAQWRSESQFREALQHPDAQPHFEECRRISTAEPVLYKLCFTAE